MDIHISPHDGVPIYLQIVNQVKYLVASGRLAPGEELPAIRVLAERLLVNPNTVARAYRELEIAGVVAEAAHGRHLRLRRRLAAWPAASGSRSSPSASTPCSPRPGSSASATDDVIDLICGSATRCCNPTRGGVSRWSPFLPNSAET